jgi:hypothetical protein
MHVLTLLAPVGLPRRLRTEHDARQHSHHGRARDDPKNRLVGIFPVTLATEIKI